MTGRTWAVGRRGIGLVGRCRGSRRRCTSPGRRGCVGRRQGGGGRCRPSGGGRRVWRRRGRLGISKGREEGVSLGVGWMGVRGMAYAHHAVGLGAHGVEGGGVRFWCVHVGRWVWGGEGRKTRADEKLSSCGVGCSRMRRTEGAEGQDG
jgi:hypothetical protein